MGAFQSNKSLTFLLLALVCASFSFTNATTATSSSNDLCNACHSTSWLFDRIGQNLTDDQLKKTFVDFCTQDYNGANQFVCKHVAKGLLPVFRTIGSKDFCKKMKVCGGGQASTTFVITKPTLDGTNYCDVCKEIVSEIQVALSNKTLINEIEQKADDYCALLPSNSDECKAFVDSELTSVVEWIEAEQPLTFCQSLDFCDTSAVQTLPNKDELMMPMRHFESQPQASPSQDQMVLITSNRTMLQSISKAKCVVCDEVMKWAFKFLQQNRTEQAIEHALGAVCPMFYRHDKLKQAHCDQLVSEYTQQFIHLIVQQVHPDAICYLLNFCPSSSSLNVTLKQIADKSDNHQSLIPTVQKAVAKQQAGPGCFVCVQLFRYVYKHLNGSETSQELENIMDHGCDFLFNGIDHNKSHLQKCKKMVASNAETLVKLIKSNAGPTLTCLAIGICFANDQQQLLMQVTSQPPTTHHYHFDASRSDYLCNKVAQNTFDRVQQDSRELRTWVELGKVCDHAFPDEEKSECAVYVHRQQDQLKQALLQAQSVGQVCELVSPRSSQLSHSSRPTPTVQGEGCELCKLFLGFVYKDLKENKTQAAIIKVLDEACDKYVPVKHREECHAYVKAYVVELIDIIENSTNPAEACSSLGYCGARKGRLGLNGPEKILSNVFSSSMSAVSLPSKPKSIACDECIKFFTPIHTLLANKTCENLLLADAEKICSNCPDYDHCVNVLQDHIKVYFNAVDHYSDPQLVCQHIGICPKASDRPDRVLFLNRRFYNRHRSSSLSTGPQSDLGLSRQLSTLNSFSPKNWRKEACFECQILTGYVQSLLLNATIDQSIVNFAKHEFCDPLTSKLERIACDDFFKHYGITIIQHFATNTFNQTRVCNQEMHVCPGSQLPHYHHRDQSKLLGAHECTYGPSFWCKSAENARMCKATEFCERKAWNVRN